MYLPREMEAEVEKWLERGLSVVLVGPRQSGKTTLLKHLSKKRSGLYITLEDPRWLHRFEDITLLVPSLKGKELYIDEAQYDPEIGRKLKYLHDVEGMRFVASGSGSFDVKVKVSGELVGRAARLVLLPLSFGEFLRWRDEGLWNLYKEARELSYRVIRGEGVELPERDIPGLREYWKEYLRFGGYPAVVLMEGEEEKREMLAQIISAYIDRDVMGFFDVRDRRKFEKVMMALSEMAGGLVNKSTLSEVSGATYKALEGYLSILEQTFVIFRVYRYPPSLSSLRKQPKVYFYDTGVMNVLNENVSPGALVENFVARHLKERFGKIYYYREKRLEVDFVVNDVPVEVKKGKRRSRAIHRFAEKFGSPHKVIIREGPPERKGDTYLIPPWFL
ncbi:MAG: ATP-binding protein [Candidatus Diapherotrites archaeon]|nr:ATP-binding protein [Candidatus Diapherotrites archaeon]